VIKPVVSSLVALAIAIAAPVAMATPESAPSKHVVHKTKKKAEHKTPIVHVKLKKSDKKAAEGHKGEPKVDKSGRQSTTRN